MKKPVPWYVAHKDLKITRIRDNKAIRQRFARVEGSSARAEAQAALATEALNRCTAAEAIVRLEAVYARLSALESRRGPLRRAWAWVTRR